MFHVPFGFKNVNGCNDERSKNSNGEDGSEISGGGGVEERVEILWRHVFVDLVLCGGSEKDVKIMMGWFIEVCRRQGLKINADKNEVIVVGG